MIEHKDIVDGERHELKGASTAANGTVPVSNGAGGTVFKKLGLESWLGSVSTGLADQVILTDGAGGLKTASASAYASFLFTDNYVFDVYNIASPASPLPRAGTVTPNGAVKGFSYGGGLFFVNVSGVYRLTGYSNNFDPFTPTTTPYQTATIYARDSGQVITTPTFVTLAAGTAYAVHAVSATGSATVTIERVLA